MFKLKVRFVHAVMTATARKGLTHEYGTGFYRDFAGKSKQKLNALLEEVPDIGESIFSFNYLFGPCYFSWYSTLLSLNLDKSSALQLIWQINEDFVRAIPNPLLRWFGKNMYLGGFRRKAIIAEERGKVGSLHPMDWRIEYRSIDGNTFTIDIYECAMLKLADKLGYREMFPHVCRMDYLFSHYFGQSFKRSSTLADGNICCDCWYQAPGSSEWAPEKGFINRK